jgi:hypothetical protein
LRRCEEVEVTEKNGEEKRKDEDNGEKKHSKLRTMAGGILELARNCKKSMGLPAFKMHVQLIIRKFDSNKAKRRETS